MSYKDDLLDNDLRNLSDDEVDDEEEFHNTVILNDEDGNEIPFEFLDLIEYEGEEYVVLLPPGDDEVVILKIEEGSSEDEESYTSVDSEKTLTAVFELFKSRNADAFNFVDK